MEFRSRLLSGYLRKKYLPRTIKKKTVLYQVPRLRKKYRKILLLILRHQIRLKNLFQFRNQRLLFLKKSRSFRLNLFLKKLSSKVFV